MDIVKDYKTTKFGKELINQLIRIPTIHFFEHRQEQLLFRTLFTALSDNGKFYQYFLGKDRYDIITYPLTYDDANDSLFSKTFYLDQKNNETHGHLNHICSASIPNGKMVYNCYDCGVDPTCCLCEDCFNKEEHSDHNVSVHRSSGNAICDCGDISSWNVDLNCKANNSEMQLKNSLPDLPIQLKLNIKIMIRILFDYLLDIQLTNLSTLPKFSNDENLLTELKKLSNIQDYDKDLASTTYKLDYIEYDQETYDLKDDTVYLGNFLDYNYLIIWNDEFHNYDQAKRFLSANEVPSEEVESDDFPYYELNYENLSNLDAKYDIITNLAKTIDEKGYVCYARSKDISVLKSKTKNFDLKANSKSDNLTYSILNGKEYSNLVISRAIILWFNFILKNKNIVFTEFIKEEISNVLLERANFHLKEISLFKNLKEPYNLDHKLRIPVYHESLIKPEEDDEFSVKNIRVDLNSHYNLTHFADGSRLQYLIFFEMRYPKSMRVLIRKTIIPNLTNSIDSRFQFAKQFLELLSTYEYNVSNYDREWHLSIVDTFRLQVYHDPHLGTQLLKLGLLENTIDSLLNVFKNSKCLVNSKFKFISYPSWHVSRNVKELSNAIEGFNTLLKFIHKGEDSIFNDSMFIKIFRLITAFDRYLTLFRKTGSHEEFEDSRICYVSYLAAVPIYSIAESLGRIVSGIECPNSKVEKSIALVSSYMRDSNDWNFDFDITKEGVSMINPVASLLGSLCKNYKFFEPKLFNNVIKLIDNNYNYSYEDMGANANIVSFVNCADTVLQPYVLHSQISSNFWVRNGDYVRIANSFFYSFEPENLIFILQQAILLDNLSLSRILSRFQLLSCINGETNFDNTPYEEKITIILDEFLSLMYYILTYRILSDSTLDYEARENLENKFKIISILATSPKKYSNLKKELSSIPNFEEILDEVSTYVPPSSYNDYGQYTLKPDYWNKIDPFDYNVDKASFSEIEESVLKNLATLKNKKLDDVVIIPNIYSLNEEDSNKFSKIGAFMRTSEFVKMLYKILRFAVTSENDSHLNITLHLIHAIIIDNELNNKKLETHGLRNFVDIPICNLLLSVTEKSELPKYISKKASTILELLLLKDDDVLTSLMECFGAEHVEEYKKSKHGKTLETKAERKKRLALKRQKKVLQKMMKQQTDFANKNKTYFSDDDGNNDDSNISESSSNKKLKKNVLEKDNELRSCVLCKNPVSHDSLFGIPSFINASSDFWNIPTLGDNPPEFMIEEFNGLSETSSNNMNCRSGCTREKLVINGCPHGMHFKCFKNMLREKSMKSSNFECPLCKGKFNSFIPLFENREFEVDPNVFEHIKYDENIVNSSIYGENIAILTTQIFDKAMFKVLSNPDDEGFKNLMKEVNDLNKENGFLKKVLPPVKSKLESFRKNLSESYYLQFIMPILIGSTLEMGEISSRKGNTNYLSEILTSTLRSLLQYRILNNYEPTRGEVERKKYFQFLVHYPYFGLSETVMLLYTESGFPLVDCIKFALMKRIILTALSIVQRYNVDPANLNFDSILDDEIPTLNKHSIIYQSLYKIFEGVTEQFSKVTEKSYSIEPIYVEKLYKILRTNFKNYQRQVNYISLFLNTLPCDEGRLLPTIDEFLTQCFDTSTTEFSFQCIIVENLGAGISEKTFPSFHRRDADIDFIEYPKPVHFIELPEKLKDIAVVGLSKEKKPPQIHPVYRRNKKKNKTFNHICLHCGEWLSSSGFHRLKCPLSSFCTIIFTPVKNQLELHLPPDYSSAAHFIESPYLNKHGEPSEGMIGYGDSGTLNVARYEHLQKTWLDQTIIAKYLRTRRIYGLQLLHANQDDSFIPGIYEGPQTFNDETDRASAARNERNAAIARMLGIPIFQDEEELDADFSDDNDDDNDDDNESVDNNFGNNIMDNVFRQMVDDDGTTRVELPAGRMRGEDAVDGEFVFEGDDVARAEFLRALFQNAGIDNFTNFNNNQDDEEEEEDPDFTDVDDVDDDDNDNDNDDNDDDDDDDDDDDNDDDDENISEESQNDEDNGSMHGYDDLHIFHHDGDGYFSDEYNSEEDGDYFDAMEVD